MMRDLARLGSFAVRHCASGCLHVDLGGVTLHLDQEQFLQLAAVVGSARRALHGEHTHSHEVSVSDEESLVM
jgi:hypothetical protein